MLKPLAFIFIFALLRVFSVAQTPVFRPHQPEERTQSKIKVIQQSHNGSIWMGTENGVFRYDGLDYEYFSLPDSISTVPNVSAIFDSGDTLWVGFDNGLIALLPEKKIANFRYTRPDNTKENHHGVLTIWQPEEGTPSKEITGFAADLAGNLWISTYGEGLYTWTGKRMYQFNNSDEGLCSDEIYTLLSDQQGQIWVATDNGISLATIGRAGQKTIRNLGLKDGLPDEIVTALHKDLSGNIWIGTHDGGVCRYDAQDHTFHLVMEHWNYGEVFDLVVYDDVELWITTSEGGLLHSDLKGIVQLIKPPTKAKQVLRDREGLLWLLGENGTVFSANLSVLHEATSFSSVQAICTEQSGRVWAGNQTGLFVQKSNQWVQIGQKNSNIIALLRTPENQIWAGTFGEGISVYDTAGKRIKRMTISDGLPNGSILSMEVVGDLVWVATLGGIVVVHRNTFQVIDFESISDHAEAAKYYVYKIFCDSKGRVWCCTDGHGLGVWEHGKWRNWTESGGVSLKTIYSVVEDHDGRIWFSGDQTSLWRFDGVQLKQYTLKDHLHSTQINSLAITGHGQLVMGYSNGIDVLTPETGHISFLGENAGVAISDISLNAACTDPLGNVWLGTASGVSRVAGYVQTFEIDPSTLIKTVVNVAQNIDFEHDHTFAYDKNHLIFEYAGIWLTNPTLVYYRYKLDGFDPDWTISKDRMASYPNLPPGQYCFRVQSSEHGYFEQTAEATYTFTIRKPFWAEWWFVLAIMAILGTLIRWYIKVREQRLKVVQEMENEKIAAQLDVLKTQISPHFLFNSFNTLITIIEESPEMAVDYVQHLADFYRSIMVHREKNFIPLSEDLDIARNFGFLLKKRFEDALQIHIDVPEPIGRVMPLTLQMLLENAVKHNVISKKQPLKIDIYLENNDTIVVKNNKNLKIKPEPGTRFGLQNLAQRYEVLTGKKVVVEQSNGSFIVKIPLD